MSILLDFASAAVAARQKPFTPYDVQVYIEVILDQLVAHRAHVPPWDVGMRCSKAPRDFLQLDRGRCVRHQFR
jgi:hypothetical protein